MPAPPPTNATAAPTFRVRAFGAAREIVGAPTVEVDAAALTGAPTAADLHRALTARYPALAEIGTVRYAVDEAFVDDDHAVAPADDIALLPPVSGG